MRYLLDTNVLVAGFRSRSGASHALLRRAMAGGLDLVIHHKLVWEYRDVLSRPQILAEIGLPFEEIEVVLAHLVKRAIKVDVRFLWRPNLRDEADNFVMEIAVAAWPCTIVTHNLADFAKTGLRFPQVSVMTPGQLMQQLNH